MPHVADGILHAYLDGALPALAEAGALPDGASPAEIEAHLRSCDDCRARLDRERTIHEDSRQVLQAAAPPAPDLPEFDVLFRPAAARRARRAWLPAAWAASVLLAVGAGWWGSEIRRDVLPGGPASRSAEDAAAAPLAAAPDPAGGPGAASGSATETGSASDAADTPVAGGSGGDAGGRRIAQVDAESAPRAFAPAAPPAESAADVLSEKVSPPAVPLGRAEGPRAASMDLPLALAAVPAPLAPAGVVTETVDLAVTGAAPQEARLESRLESRRVEVRQGEPAASLPLLPPGERPAIGGQMRPQAPQQDLAIRSAAGAFRPDRAARGATAEPERERPAQTVLVVEGAGDPVIEATEHDSRVRVRQRVDGSDIELLIWTAPGAGPDAIDSIRAAGRAGAAAGRESARDAFVAVSDGELPDGGRELVIWQPASAVYVALRGDVPAATLRQLAARLIPWR